MAALSISGMNADRPRMGQPLRTMLRVRSVFMAFSSWASIQFVIVVLSVTSTVPTRFVTTFTGSTTRMAYSPNTRSVTTRPVCGSCTSSIRPPKRSPVNSRVDTKYSSAL